MINGPTEIYICNDFGSLELDGYGLSSSANNTFVNGISTFIKVDFVWGLEDKGGSVFDSLDLPLSPPDLNEFESNYFLIRLENSCVDTACIYGTMNALTPVPTPSAMILCSVGVGIAGWVKKRKMI